MAGKSKSVESLNMRLAMGGAVALVVLVITGLAVSLAIKTERKVIEQTWSMPGVVAAIDDPTGDEAAYVVDPDGVLVMPIFTDYGGEPKYGFGVEYAVWRWRECHVAPDIDVPFTRVDRVEFRSAGRLIATSIVPRESVVDQYFRFDDSGCVYVSTDFVLDPTFQYSEGQRLTAQLAVDVDGYADILSEPFEVILTSVGEVEAGDPSVSTMIALRYEADVVVLEDVADVENTSKSLGGKAITVGDRAVDPMTMATIAAAALAAMAFGAWIVGRQAIRAALFAERTQHYAEIVTGSLHANVGRYLDEAVEIVESMRNAGESNTAIGSQVLDNALRGIWDSLDEAGLLAQLGWRKELTKHEPFRLAEALVGSKVAIDILDSGHPINGNLTIFKMAVKAILGNAVEHGGATMVVVTREPGLIRFEDNGTGMEWGPLMKAWKKGIKVNGEGSGWGIALIKRVMEAHGAEVVMRSGVDRGVIIEIKGI